jgi:hypothetical protein
MCLALFLMSCIIVRGSCTDLHNPIATISISQFVELHAPCTHSQVQLLPSQETGSLHAFRDKQQYARKGAEDGDGSDECLNGAASLYETEVLTSAVLRMEEGDKTGDESEEGED